MSADISGEGNMPRAGKSRVVDRIACRKIGMNGTKNVAGHAWRIVRVLGTVETHRGKEREEETRETKVVRRIIRDVCPRSRSKSTSERD